nr:MAG TPA: hypothetical protein [Caudoviricetes sp.]
MEIKDLFLYWFIIWQDTPGSNRNTLPVRLMHLLHSTPYF